MASSSKPRNSLQAFMSRLPHLYTALDLLLTGISTHSDSEDLPTGISYIDTEDLPTGIPYMDTEDLKAIKESHVEDQTVNRLPQTNPAIEESHVEDQTVNELPQTKRLQHPTKKKGLQVYISFRGADVRNSFVEHLYTALNSLPGISPYFDSEELRKGEQISSSLMRAIEESQASIIIFSEHYASSPWCLEELTKIMECQAQKDVVVLPVFYKVEPREVRFGRKAYGEAMVKHECKFGEDSKTVKKWKKALLDAGNLAGWELHYGNSEAKTIKDIVKRISELTTYYDVFLNFRGKDVRENFIKSLHEALVQKGIRTFMDSEDLEMGQEFPPKLKKAIKLSRMYIVVFSENYAESWWCLKELAQILGEKNKTKHLLPIFYKVAPGEVRGQKQSYEKALTTHLSEFGKRKVKKWKEALSKAANLQGIHLHDGNMHGGIPRIFEEIEKMMPGIG